MISLFFRSEKIRKQKMPGKKVNLMIKREALSLLETHAVRETTRIINTRYSMDLQPYTVLRWKQKKVKILKNVTTSKATEKNSKKLFIWSINVSLILKQNCLQGVWMPIDEEYEFIR